MNSVKSICNNFESMTDNNKITLLLYGDSRFDENKNKFILQSSMKYIKTTERFSRSLFKQNFINFTTLRLIFPLIYPDSFNFSFLIFTNLIFVFMLLLFFFVSIFRFPRQFTLLLLGYCRMYF